MTTTRTPQHDDSKPDRSDRAGSGAPTVTPPTRGKRTTPFTQIANAALIDKALSLRAKGLLALMLSRPPRWKFRMDWLQKQSREGREATQSALRELLEYGYCTQTVRRGKNGRLDGWHYTVTDCPQPRVASVEDTAEPSDRQTASPPDGSPPPNKKEFNKTEINTFVAGAPGDGQTKLVSSQPTTADSTTTVCELLGEAFQTLRLTKKEVTIARQARLALETGFTPDDIAMALRWAHQDSWWQGRLVPSNLTKMLTRWDAFRRGMPPKRQDRPHTHPPAPAVMPGERRQTPGGRWLTVQDIADGHVFWVEDAEEASVQMVVHWRAELEAE